MANRTRDTANLVSDNNLYVNITTDKVGIGTTNPTSKLTVQGDVLVSGVLTATRLYSDIYGEFVGGAISGDSIVGTALSISGISTLGGDVTVGNGITMYASTGIVSATAFYGNGENLTELVKSKLAGITVLEENALVGTEFQFSELNFIGSYVTATGIGSTATITFTNPENVIGGVASVTSLNVTGISTLGTVEISSGIVTATTGVVTYYGDGSNLTGVSAFSVQQQSITATPVYPTFASNIGVSSIGIAATQVAYIPASGNLGIGTTTPLSKLDVRGDVSIASTLGIGTVIDIVPYDTLNSGTLSWEGSAGQLFSIKNNLTTGSIYSVNDVSGIPSIDVDANGTIQLGPYGGNIGLGTTNPTSKLHVVGDVLVSGVLTATRLYSDIYGEFVGGAISGDSIVGTALSISGISTLGTVKISSGIVTATTGVVTYYGDGSNLTGVSAFSVQQQSITATPVYPTFASNIGVSSIGIAATQVAYIPSSGNLGIGTTTPLSKLDVRGDVSIASTLGIGTIIDIVPYDTLNSGTLSWEGSEGQLFSITNNLTTGSIYSVNNVSGIPSIDVDANGTIQLGPYGGNIGLGTTNPTSKLHVVGDVLVSGASTFGGIVELDSSLRDFYNNVGAAGSVLISTGAGVSWSASTPSAAAVTISDDTFTNAVRYPMFEDITSGTVETVNVSSSNLRFNPFTGTLFAKGFTSLSDRTQKEDIRPIENSIEIVKQLTGVRYNWKNNTNQPSIGLIAQDVEEVIPEVVVEMADGLKSVSYGNIVAVLIEAIKEQQVRIEELESRLNA